MKASKVVRILEKKTIKECVKKYTIVSSSTGEYSKYGSFQTKDSMYDEIRKDMADFVGVAECLAFDVFGCRVRISNGDDSKRADLYYVHVTNSGFFTIIEELNDEIIDPSEESAKETLDEIHILNKLDESYHKKALEMLYNSKRERIIRNWFDADGKLAKDKKCVTLDTEYSIDDNILMDEVKKNMDLALLGEEKTLTWSAELIEDSLVHYEVPTLALQMVPDGDITSGKMRNMKYYDLTEDLKVYEPRSFTIFEERKPLYKMDDDFKKHLTMTCIFGAAHFILFFCLFAHWLFVPLYFAAIAATVFFGIKTFSESSKGKKRKELEKIAQENNEKETKECIDEIVEELTNKVIVNYKVIE